MVMTAERSGIERSELAKTINGWEMDGRFLAVCRREHLINGFIGNIWSKASQVRAVSSSLAFCIGARC